MQLWRYFIGMARISKNKKYVDKPIYDRLPKETDNDFHLFIKYRQLDPLERSLKLTSELTGQRLDLIQDTAMEHRWIERVKAWDWETDRALKVRQLKQIQDMQRRHAEIGEGLLNIAERELIKASQMVDRQIDTPYVKINELLQLVECGAKLERLSREEPSEIVENRDKEALNLKKLSKEELRQLNKIKMKLLSGSDV